MADRVAQTDGARIPAFALVRLVACTFGPGVLLAIGFLFSALASRPAVAGEVRTSDGLALRLSAGGNVESLRGGATTFKPTGAAQPVFRVREVGTKAWTDLTGIVQQDGNQLRQSAIAGDLQLSLEATYTVHRDHVEITGAVSDKRGAERSVELMCALPAQAPKLRWHLDMAESVTLPVSGVARTGAPAKALGNDSAAPYALWIDAFDCDPQMASVSIVCPDGQERLLAVLAPPDAGKKVDQQWRTLVVPGVRESDFANDTLRVRIENFRGGPTLMDVGAVYLMDARDTPANDDQASALTDRSVKEATAQSLGSWSYAADYRPKKDGRQWHFERRAQQVSDGGWFELAIRRGEHREGDLASIVCGQSSMIPDAEGILDSLGYPWATITVPGAGGYSLAVSPEMPCLYRLQYDTAAQEVQLILSYGLSSLPKRPELKSRAPFRLALFRTDDDWGFREATERYYALAPELFDRPTDRFGFWFGSGPDKDYQGLGGEYAYLEVHEARLYPRHFLKDRAAWSQWKDRLAEYFPQCNELGILGTALSTLLPLQPARPRRYGRHAAAHAQDI